MAYAAQRDEQMRSRVAQRPTNPNDEKEWEVAKFLVRERPAELSSCPYIYDYEWVASTANHKGDFVFWNGTNKWYIVEVKHLNWRVGDGGSRRQALILARKQATTYRTLFSERKVVPLCDIRAGICYNDAACKLVFEEVPVGSSAENEAFPTVFSPPSLRVPELPVDTVSTRPTATSSAPQQVQQESGGWLYAVAAVAIGVIAMFSSQNHN